MLYQAFNAAQSIATCWFVKMLCEKATSKGPWAPFSWYSLRTRREPHFPFKTMHRTIEGHRESSYLAKLEADRQAQHSGYGIRPYHCANGTIKWEAYGWERLTELTMHETSYGLFDHKWEAEQYFNAIVH
jgi:hypothetical protein